MTKLQHEKKHNDENIVDLGGTYGKLNDFFNKNKKVVYGVFGAIVVAVGGYMYYMNMIKGPREKEAFANMYKAEFYFGVDSFNLALNGRGEDFMGFLQITEEYGNTKAGNLAHYYAGVCLMKLGRFDEAISMLKEFSSKDVLLGPIALGCIGDCYRELNQSEEAVKYYEKAAKKNDNNFTSPLYLKKAALTYEEDLQNTEKALELYKKIRNNYGNSTEGRDVSKYIKRIETMQGS